MNAQCLFDQGDCCNKTLVGNRKCDAVNNFTQCEFDGGDCCDHSLTANGICDDFNNFPSCENYDGGDCRPPNIKHMPECPYNPELIGDGICLDHFNNTDCHYDMGDCCVKSLFGDKRCHQFNNFEKCNFDGNDCRSLGNIEWPDCPHNPIFIGDGVCDDHLRNAHCDYDSDDCKDHAG